MAPRSRSSPPPDVARELEQAVLARSGRREGDEIWFQCPFPANHRHGDADPSAQYNTRKFVWHCHACKEGGDWRSLCDLSGIDYERTGHIISTTYGYTDEDGELLFEVVRRIPKDFRQRQPDGKGGWVWNTKGVRKVLYRLPDVIAAVLVGRTVYVVEGEKDADNLSSLGLVATTNPGGAGKWHNDYTETLRGARVAIVPDNDKPGARHAQKLATTLYGVAAEVRIVRLPDLPDGGDVSDWLARMSGSDGEETDSRAELERLAREAPVWEPTDADDASGGQDDTEAPAEGLGMEQALQDLWALGSDPKPRAVQQVLIRLAANLEGANPLAVQTARERTKCALKGKVSGPAQFFDAALKGVKVAPPASSLPASDPGGEPPYEATENGLVRRKTTNHGPVEVPLTNFTATIICEIKRDDGVEIQRSFEIAAYHHGEVHRFEVGSKQFPSLRWVTEQLGATAIIYAGIGTRDHARAAIQSLSDSVEERTVFTHLGWRKIGDEWCYLHSGGAIGRVGQVPNVETDLPPALEHFTLPEPPAPADLERAVHASLRLLDLVPDEIGLPLYCAIVRATLGAADFAEHLAGLTGEGKTELAALLEQHFGPALDARHLPGSWSSTGNALEVLAFSAKDALLVVDDFAPEGTSFDIQRFHREAARLIRAQGNRAGRRRLRPDGTMRPVKAPRGLILSTGEDIPGGHSVRARVLALELPRGAMDWELLTRCQKDAASGCYAQMMSGYLQWLAPRYEEIQRSKPGRIEELRGLASESTVHRRTPAIVAELAFGLEQFLAFARESAVLSDSAAQELWSRGWAALGQAAAAQADHLEDQDPARQFIELLSSAVSSGAAHVASEDGSAPESPSRWGWRRQRTEWQAQGVRVGWLLEDDLYLDSKSAYKAAQGMATGGGLSVTPRTLWKRLNERGLLASVDSKRQSLKVRATLDSTRRSVLHLKACDLLTQEPAQPAQLPGIAPGSGAGSWAGSESPDEEPAQRTRPEEPVATGPSATRGQVGQVSPSEGTDADDWEDA